MKWGLIVNCLLLSFCLTGCWDVTELNQRAIVIGSAIDLARDGGVLITEQIVIPQGPKTSPGSTGKNFFVVSATGYSWMDAFQHLQTQLSRQIYLSHRRTLYVGERLADHGIRPYLDELSRNPDSRLRTDLVVVRGDDAKSVMKLATPLEKLPSNSIEGIFKMLGMTPGKSLLDCLIAAASDTSYPAAPEFFIKRSVKRGDETLDAIQFSGLSIFNRDFQRIGRLNYLEAICRLWMTKSLAQQYLTVVLPGPTRTYASLALTGFSAHMTPRIKRNHRLSMQITLGAKAAVIENGSSLDLKKRAPVRTVENALNHQIADQALRAIRRVQRSYGADIYGFDEVFKRTFPKQWGVWKHQWREQFAGMDLTVHCDVTIITSGATGSPLGTPETATTNASDTP